MDRQSSTFHATDELVGHVGSSEIKQGIETGYASEAVAAFGNWGKRESGVEDICGIVDSKNYASIKVLENAGFHLVKNDAEGDSGKSACRKIYMQ